MNKSNGNKEPERGKQMTAADNPDAFLEEQAMQERLAQIKHKILVLSGKGGVGKSTVAVNLAIALMRAGKRVGLLDVDIHGPSVPKLLGLENTHISVEDGAMLPAEKDGLKVMSIGFLLQGRDDAVIWRGPMKTGVIKQFLKDVSWGELDYLVIDSPPGTGDEPLSICQLVKNADGAVIVTTPQEVSTNDVRRSITFCRQLNLPVLGVVENMSGFVCPKCGAVTDIFKTGGGERMAAEMQAPFLGRIPLDPAIGQSCDEGQPFVTYYNRTETAKAFTQIAAPILALSGPPGAVSTNRTNNPEKGSAMKIAIPIVEGKLSMHFGHCQQFAVFEIDKEAGKITGRQLLTPPEHEPGVFPKWLHEQGANVIIAGGMGQRAQKMFTDNGIEVLVGAAGSDPEQIAAAWLAGTLQTGANVCDH